MSEEVSHRWQNFRIKCLELAIASGAKTDEAITLAEKFGEYIIVKSELEKQIKPNADDQEEKA